MLAGRLKCVRRDVVPRGGGDACMRQQITGDKHRAGRRPHDGGNGDIPKQMRMDRESKVLLGAPTEDVVDCFGAKAGHLGDHHMVLDAGMTEDSLRHVVDTGLGHGESLLGGFWDHFHPVIPLVVIAGMHGYKVAVGTQTIADAMEVAGARAQRALVTTSAGTIAKVIGLGWFSIPAALLAGYWVTNQQNIDELADFYRERNRRLRLQANSYPMQHLPT